VSYDFVYSVIIYNLTVLLFSPLRMFCTEERIIIEENWMRNTRDAE